LCKDSVSREGPCEIAINEAALQGARLLPRITFPKMPVEDPAYLNILSFPFDGYITADDPLFCPFAISNDQGALAIDLQCQTMDLAT
jgi:hypothetical protein